MTTTYDYDDDFTSVDDDLLLAGSDGYLSGGAGSGSNFWSLKEKTSYKLYFLSDPWTKDIDHGWWNWREVFAAEGLVGGIDLKGTGLMGFPVRDQRTVMVDGVKKRQDIPLNDPAADELLKLVVPYIPRGETKRKTPQRPVKDRIGANVVEVTPDGSYHKVVVFSLSRYKKFMDKVKTYVAMIGDDFTLVGHPWHLSITGQGAGEIIELLPIKNEPPLDEIPELIDIPEALRLQRQQVFEIVRSHTGLDEVMAYADADPSLPEPAEPGEVSAPAEEVVDREALYASWTPARMRTLLNKQGIAVPSGADRATLEQMAREAGL